MTTRFGLAALLLLSLPFATPAAEIFRWVDEKGVVHFTDNYYNIPDKQKASTTRIKASDGPVPSLPLASFDKASVPIQQSGQVVIVMATLNQKASGRFVVDTGASYTMISKATAKQLDIDLERALATLPFQTANGIIQAPLISLESLDVGGLRLQGVTAAVHDVFPDPNISGLLGLNYLSNFRLDIDTKNGFLHLEKK